MELYECDLYINDNNPYLFNADIFEYDMKDAGFSLIKEFNLLDKSTIEKLSKQDKDIRKVNIGKIQRDDKDFVSRLGNAFKEARRLFFEANNIENNDIISIKKDAIFTSKLCKFQEFGKYINFRPKNSYTSYINLGKRIEFYYNNNHMDIKGLSDENYEKHKEYMIKFIIQFIKSVESGDSISSIRFIRRFIDDYKWKELDIGYYRTFDNKSIFKVIGEDIEYDRYYEIDNLDITYNFYIILKLLKIVV
jgi:hypothetical protein|nr:MAG TPA: hypothetical protein [Caudoviricetes sp.]